MMSVVFTAASIGLARPLALQDPKLLPIVPGVKPQRKEKVLIPQLWVILDTEKASNPLGFALWPYI